MVRSIAAISLVVVVGPLAGSAFAGDGVLSKDEFTAGSYCHMKFPAIRQRTLDADRPALKSSSTGDVIDFYGPCDESPTGTDQVAAQRLEAEHRWKDYLDRG